jgi:hypothetical protein
MIARLWHGRTAIEKAKEYASFLNRLEIPDYRGSRGNLAVHILRRDEGEVAHFTPFTLWESYAAIEKFRGTPIDQAKYYPQDREFLLEFEPKVQQGEVVGSASPR